MFPTNCHAFVNIELPKKKTPYLFNTFLSVRFPPLFTDQVLVTAVELVVFTVTVEHSVNLTILVSVSAPYPIIKGSRNNTRILRVM